MSEQSRDGASTTPVSRAARWESYITSAIGADHVRAGKPNEDAVTAEHFEFGSGASVDVLAVADGHGHMRHFRSERGSKLAVTAAVAVVRSWAQEHRGRDRLTSDVAAELVSDLVTRWRRLVADDLRADPISADVAATLPPDDPPEIPYGATLLLAVLTADVAVLAQIGDGEMLLILPDGRHLEPVPSDSRLDGTRTTSLCQPDAVAAFRVGIVSLARTPAYAVFAATDGYGNAQADVSWQQVFSADLVRLGIEHGTTWIGGQLADWAAACASSDGSGDDTTAALALSPAATLTAPRRRQPRTANERTTQLRALPLSPVSDADKTLIWPDQPSADPITATAPVPAAAPPSAAPTALPPPRRAAAAPAPGLDFGHVPGSATMPRSRLLIAGLVVVVIIVAVSVYFLTRGGKAPTQPSLRPTPTASVPKPGHSSGAGTGGHHTPKPPGNLGGGGSGGGSGGGLGDLVKSSGPGQPGTGGRGGRQNV